MAKGMVNINIKVDSKGAVRDIKLVGSATKKAGKDAQSWAKAGFFASAGAKAFNLSLGLLKKSLGALLKPVKDSIFEIGVLGDKIAKQSRMIGLTAEQFQVMEFAATRSGTSLTAVTNGMKKLGRVMVDAQNGSRQIKDTFDALGITLEKDNGTLRDTFDVFLDLADKSMILGESAERTGVQMLLLGRSGTEVSNLMSQGAEGVLELKDELEDLGAIMGDQTLGAAEGFVDSMANLEHAFRGVKIELGEQLLPEFTLFATQFTTWLSTTDFSRVRELANDFFDAAIGVARFADMVFELELFPEGEEERLLTVSNRAELINRRIVEGTANYDDMHRAMSMVSSESETTYGDMKKMMELVPLEQFAVQVGEMVGPLEESNAAVFRLREEYQLTAEQMEVFAFLQEGLGSTVQEASDQMYELGQVSSVQASLLRLSARSVSEYEAAQATLNTSFETRIDLEAELKEREEARLKRIEKEREALRLRVAQLDENRKAEKQRTRARRDAAKAAKELLDIEKEMAAWHRAQAEGREKSLQDIYETFYELNRDDITSSFEKGLMSQYEFRSQMAAAAEQELIAQWSRENEIISSALREGTMAYEEADRLREQSNADLQAGRIRMAEETEATIMAFEAQQIASWGAAFGAMSDMVGTFSELIAQSYGENTEEAKAAAKKMFVVQQALALGEAILMLAVGIAQANASAPPPYNIPAIVAATATGSAAITAVIGTTIAGLADAGLPPGALKAAGLNNHSLLAMRNDEMVLDPVGTRHISEMLETQKAQMTGGGEEQTIVTTVELDGQVLGSAVDKRLIRQAERGIPYTGRIRQGYMGL
jgi:hypothetical protein